ncbi:MAG: transposase [Candidatus Hydrogenedentes bacterium]|nr:transposase [Candidatus Hydrogenedentota bacterium]
MKDFADYLSQIQEGGEVDIMKLMLETMAKAVMEAGVAEHVGADRHERSEGRKGHRNGYKPRKLKTPGWRAFLDVPQVRGTEPYSRCSSPNGAGERALTACAEMYFMGVSTRKVKHVEKMGGFGLSAKHGFLRGPGAGRGARGVSGAPSGRAGMARRRWTRATSKPALTVGCASRPLSWFAGINDDGRRNSHLASGADLESKATGPRCSANLDPAWRHRR